MSKPKNNTRAVIAVDDKVIVLQHPRAESCEGTMARAEALSAQLYPEQTA